MQKTEKWLKPLHMGTHQRVLIESYPIKDSLNIGRKKVTLEIVVWIFDTFDNNFENENNCTKYLKESCRWCSDQDFSIK